MNIKTIIFLILISLPLIVLGQAGKSDTLILKGIVFIGDTRRQIDSIKLFLNEQLTHTFSTDNLGKFEVRNLIQSTYRLLINEFKYDTIFFLGKKKEQEIWIFLPGICDVNKEIADLEIKKGQPRLLLIGGIAPKHIVGQEDFEKKFSIKYYDYGCTPPHIECVTDYNQVVFNYLDKTYGTKWRKKVRTDVIGYTAKH